MNQGYCFKCKSNKDMKNEVEEKRSKNRAYLQGQCSVCSTKMNKFIKKIKDEPKNDTKNDTKNNTKNDAKNDAKNEIKYIVVGTN